MPSTLVTRSPSRPLRCATGISSATTARCMAATPRARSCPKWPRRQPARSPKSCHRRQHPRIGRLTRRSSPRARCLPNTRAPGAPPIKPARKTANRTNFPLASPARSLYLRLTQGCGRSSGVEHNLAKVRVVSSNLIARSNKQPSSCRVFQTKIAHLAGQTARAILVLCGVPTRARPDQSFTA